MIRECGMIYGVCDWWWWETLMMWLYGDGEEGDWRDGEGRGVFMEGDDDGDEWIMWYGVRVVFI